MTSSQVEYNRPISVYRLGQMPTQSCGQSVSAPRKQAGPRSNAHTELRAKRQRSARVAIYRNRPICVLERECRVRPYFLWYSMLTSASPFTVVRKLT